MNLIELHNMAPDFSLQEVERTGGSIEDIQDETMWGIQHIRDGLNRRVILLHNGITTGTHKSKCHPKGWAIDWTLDKRDGPIDENTIYDIFRLAISAGFTGIGIYYNGYTYSFHVSYRQYIKKLPAFWKGTKERGEKNWVYRRISFI